MENFYMILLALYLPFLAAPILFAQENELVRAQKLDEQVTALYHQGKYQEAIPLAHEVLIIREKALGPEHPEVATVLNNLAELYREMGSYSESESLNKKALAIREKILGPEHPHVAKSFNNLAYLYYLKGAYEDAEPLYRRALTIWEKTLGPEHPEVATCINNLGNLYNLMGSYAKAEPLYQRALVIKKKVLGPEHPDVAVSLGNLAKLYDSMGSYAKAESLYQRALTILEKTLGSEHPYVATSLNNLAGMYQTMGSYAKAESLYQSALVIREKVLGPEHPDVASNLNNLATLYYSMGSYAKAEPLYKRALAIKEKVLGPEHSEVAHSVNNLAVLYYSMGSYDKIEPLYKRTLAVLEKTLGPEHPEVAASLNNLAVLYKRMGLCTKAEPFYQRALAIEEKVLGSEHPDVATSLNNLGELYETMGLNIKTEPLYRRALAIWEKALGPEHPNVVTSLNNLNWHWAATGKIDNTISIAKRLTSNLFHRILPYLSERRQLDFIEQNPPLSTFWPSLYLQHGAKYQGLKSLTSEVLINNKGLSLEVLTAQARKIETGDENIASLKNSLYEIRVRVASLYLAGPAKGETVAQYQEKLQNLDSIKTNLEDKLASKGYTLDSRKSQVTTSQISQALSEDNVLIDFWYFREYVFNRENKGWKKWHYLAFVSQSNRDSALIDLGEADSIDNSIEELRSSIWAGDLDESPSKQRSAEALVKAKGKQLWQQLFKPLLPAIGEKKKVIICADGLLHYLPFGVMVDEQNRYLVESYQFHYVSTSREILQWGGASGKANEAVIIADPKFDFSPSQTTTASAGSKSFESEFFTRHSRDWRQMGFSQLKYTGPEAVAIDSLLKQKGIATKLYLQDQAQEAVLKKVVSPQILHISTHGFFLPDQPELRKPKEIGGFSSIGEFDRTPALENPLLRCGLAFAGANHAESVKEGEDGLATAMEIAGLDLQGTDLVTLSACLTGFGELRSGEGVYGLHRSFLLAGAKTVIASLWSVPDLETKDLMVEFYRRYLFGEKISKSEALRQAQLAVIEQLRKKYGAAHPAYWGAFVCIGEP